MAPDLAETRESLWRLIFAPLVWAAHFLLSYVSGAIVCAKSAGDGVGTLHLLVACYTLRALALIGASTRRHWHRYRADVPQRAAGGGEARHRFLGFAGLLLCALSAVAVLYTAAVPALVAGCR